MRKTLEKNFFDFVRKNYYTVRDHCHLTYNCRGLAHSICIINVTQKQSIFTVFVIHNFSTYDCHLFF